MSHSMLQGSGPGAGPTTEQAWPSTPMLDMVFAVFVDLCSKSPVQASFFFTLEQYLTLNEAFSALPSWQSNASSREFRRYASYSRSQIVLQF